MKNRGEWAVYTPSEIPVGIPENALFWRRLSDDADFYQWSRTFYEIDQGVDATGTIKAVVADGYVCCVSHDVSMLSLPLSFSLFEIEEGEDAPALGWVLDGDVFRQPTPTITDYENAIQNLVDETARERQFRDGVTLASYTASTKPKWAAEAQAFVAWRDNVWFYAYGELAKVQAGQRPQPTVEQFLAEIAPIAWPVAP